MMPSFCRNTDTTASYRIVYKIEDREVTVLILRICNRKEFCSMVLRFRRGSR